MPALALPLLADATLRSMGPQKLAEKRVRVKRGNLVVVEGLDGDVG